ncbi:N-acetylglutaminylglutamine amidotransferase [Agromyces indicus]|uniref:asparagine synthase (glutamine-hydrolyzing) n=1 Tax=Agromyces indicus TaxID=758919 RepID=A0ABU1FN15_9MICO|nr:N-acetylglutaminylglutamine amidotransferase [Agromyces indicus]MDR5692655.1 N-acetylglutaminylglutamine amidotransferase [Agromyces indicus]
MCGITGELAFGGGRADPERVDRMSTAQAERGPDGDGLWHDGWAALGHRRLTVIDLSDQSAQPMVDEPSGLALVFNGCIYNYRELRRELAAHHRFRTDGDTEVVLRAYQHWGEEFVDHLIGMFACVLVDRRRGVAVLARDRLGIKPLYLARTGDGLRFASHLPALLAGGGIDTSLDPTGLHHYLSWHSIVPAPQTVLAGVEKLPAATIRVVSQDGRSRDRRYWQPAYERDPARGGWTDEEWTDAVASALRTAVARRTVADVPVGVLLSGGLDSSLIVALLAETAGDPVRTYSIGFEGVGAERGDEFRYSDAVAERFATEHTRLEIGSAGLASTVESTVAAMTEPMASHDLPGFFLLAEAVARDIKVVQSGQGADEVFAGYGYHASVAEASTDAAIEVLADVFFDHRHADLLRVTRTGAIPRDDVSRELAVAHFARHGVETALDAVLRLDTHLLMVDDPVKRLDCMTMAWGLEARVPFLDHELVELMASCPPELKLADGGKGPLKRLARRMLPTEVWDRPKGYFPVPALKTLDGSVLELAERALRPRHARIRTAVDGQWLDRMLDRPNDCFTPVGGNALWPFVVLELWLQEHGAG